MNVSQVSPTLHNALRDLHDPEGERGGLESRRISFVKQFKSLSAAERKELCGMAVESLKARFALAQTPDDLLCVLVAGLASERDWDATSSFLDSLLKSVTNSELLRDVALGLLDLADNELAEERGRIPLGQTALVLLTEMGLMIANHAGQSALDHRGMAQVVEYITTSLLARSNINDNAMRLSLIHYLARCPLNHQATVQLNRVISRFGQSLLDDLLKAYFEDKKRGNAAFHFLLQYLNVFFISSPALAEMSHDVLKHYMLKYPDEFPGFVSSYCEKISKEELRLEVTTRHVSLLLRAAMDVSKKPLAENLCEILTRHIAVFRDISPEAVANQVEVARLIVNPPNARVTSASSVAQLFCESTQELLNDQPADSKVIPFGKAKRLKKSKPTLKSSRIGAEPTPLETMLSLAS